MEINKDETWFMAVLLFIFVVGAVGLTKYSTPSKITININYSNEPNSIVEEQKNE